MKKINSKIFVIIFIFSFIIILTFLIKTVTSKNNRNLKITDNIVASQIQESKETTILLEETIPYTDKQSDSTKAKTTNQSKKTIFKTSDKTYFDDALFIGDSRTVGLSEYGGLDNATFFSNIGLSVYNIHKIRVSIPSVGKVHLNELLQRKKYGKIYIMLGINELGYELKNTVEQYDALIKEIQYFQPNSIIYIEANLHVTKSRSYTDKIFNNNNINHFNNEIQNLANNSDVFYIDINEVFDDKSGNLSANYTNDNTHLYAKYYKKWVEWLLTKTI